MATAALNNTGPLSLERLLVERLQAALASRKPAVHVLSAADLDGVAEERQLVPAVHVVLAGIKPLSATVGDTLTECGWYTVLTLRNVGTVDKGAAMRVDANALANAVYTSLIGWTPPGHSKPLRLAPGPAGGNHNGFMYLPLLWRTEFVWRADITTPNNPFFP